MAALEWAEHRWRWQKGFMFSVASAVDVAFVALSDYESSTTLKLQGGTKSHGVIKKPFRSPGILSTLVLARAPQGFQ